MLKYLFRPINKLSDDDKRNVIYKIHILAILSVAIFISLLIIQTFKITHPNLFHLFSLIIILQIPIVFIVFMVKNMKICKSKRMDILEDCDFCILKIIILSFSAASLIFLLGIIFE